MNEKKERLIFDVTYQPQVRTVRDTQRIMLDVIIATLPIVGFGVYRFGWHALLLVVSSMAAAVLTTSSMLSLICVFVAVRDCRVSTAPSARFVISINKDTSAIARVRMLSFFRPINRPFLFGVRLPYP